MFTGTVEVYKSPQRQVYARIEQQGLPPVFGWLSTYKGLEIRRVATERDQSSIVQGLHLLPGKLRGLTEQLPRSYIYRVHYSFVVRVGFAFQTYILTNTY